MIATGLVRRIDDLGRVVIPREVRQRLKIREGAPLEVFITNDGEVIFKKYMPTIVDDLRNSSDTIASICRTMGQAMKFSMKQNSIFELWLKCSKRTTAVKENKT